MFSVALLFTLLSITVNEDHKKILMNLLAMLSWFVLGLSYVAAEPTFASYGYLFLAIGLMFFINTIIAATDMIKPGTFRG